MANQVVGGQQACYEFNSFIRGLYFYQDIWTVMAGKVLLLKRETDNAHDTYTVAVVRQSDRATVGHIPYNLAPILSPFLARDFNKGVAEITGSRVNQGAVMQLKCCALTDSMEVEDMLIVPKTPFQSC